MSMCLITLGSVVACQAVGFPVYIGSCSIFYLENSCLYVYFLACIWVCSVYSILGTLTRKAAMCGLRNGHWRLHTASVWNGLWQYLPCNALHPHGQMRLMCEFLASTSPSSQIFATLFCNFPRFKCTLSRLKQKERRKPQGFLWSQTQSLLEPAGAPSLFWQLTTSYKLS